MMEFLLFLLIVSVLFQVVLLYYTLKMREQLFSVVQLLSVILEDVSRQAPGQSSSDLTVHLPEAKPTTDLVDMLVGYGGPHSE